MARVKTGVVRRRRHKKVLKLARGFYSGRRKHFRKAKEQLERSLVYAYRDRRRKKKRLPSSLDCAYQCCLQTQ